MSDGAWQQRGLGKRRRRWPLRLVLAMVPAGVVLALLAWLFADDIAGVGHPFGDARACSGSDTGLAPALRMEQIGLPRVTTDLHYWTHEVPPRSSAGYTFEAAFHTTRQALAEYLAAQGLADPDRSAHPDEANDGSIMGEPTGEGWGCGVGEITATFVSIPKDLGVDRQFTVGVELGRDFKIPAHPEVIVTVT